jgi:hypothetical protein
MGHGRDLIAETAAKRAAQFGGPFVLAAPKSLVNRVNGDLNWGLEASNSGYGGGNKRILRIMFRAWPVLLLYCVVNPAPRGYKRWDTT